MNIEVFGFGATSKSTTILNYYGIDKSYITKIYDNSPTKIGCVTPITDIPIVSDEESEQSSNILALGLRNPWKFFEVNDSLYIFDVGLYDFEELNVLKYENLPGNFGWPYFEGIKRSKDILEDTEYKIDINTFSSDKYASFEEYIEHEVLLPTVFYDHKASESTSRFAIIGGDLIFDNSSDFNFVCYISICKFNNITHF